MLLAAVAGVAVWLLTSAPGSADEGLRTFTFRQGPMAVGPYEVLYTPSNKKAVQAPGVDGYIVHMHARVVDEHGRPIPVRHLMLHHVVYKDRGRFDGDRIDPVCGSQGQSFYGNGEENETLRLPKGYGYRIRKGDRWTTAWMLMNHTDRPRRAYIEYRVTVDTRHRLKPVTPYWVRVTGCPRRGRIDPIFDVPGNGGKRAIDRRSTTWRMPASGTLVAGGSHLHGGSKALTVSEPRCGGRSLMRSVPLYGLPSHPYYHVLPVLHEPGPINTSWLETRTGIPVRKGERLRVTATYDDAYPHTRVMAIMHLYVYQHPVRRQACAPLPRDLRSELVHTPGRREPPHVTVPLTGLDRAGHAHRIAKPPGPTLVVGGDAQIGVHNFRFGVPNLSVPVGARVLWRFDDDVSHNVTVANGPAGFSSYNLHRGGSFSRRLTRPGVYRFYCSLHPVQMTASIAVRPRGG